MERNKKTIFIQDYLYNNYDGFGTNWWNTNLPLQYKFTSNQMIELNEYRVDFDLKILPLQDKLRALQIKMDKYIKINNPDAAKVKEYITKISNIQYQIVNIRRQAKKNMNSIFTDEQRGYFNETLIDWWNGFYSRCGWV